MKNSKRHKTSGNGWERETQNGPTGSEGRLWLYGRHTVLAALNNPKRQKHRLVVTSDNLQGISDRIEPEILDRLKLEQLLPTGAVHQGIALLTSPLPETVLEDIIDQTSDYSVIVVLDQANDPRNVGAVLRSAAAFQVDAVIVPDRRTPKNTAGLAKSASGALDKIPLLRVTNLARTLDDLKDAGYWCAGLVPDANQTLAEAKLSGKIILILGAEGRGIRRLTREKCDFLVRIPIGHSMNTLNLSAAAAISLYELKRN